MKRIVKWLVKKYALDAIKDAVAAKSDTVAAWSARVAGWLAKARLAVAYLERLAGRLQDGALTDDEADASIEEAEVLVGQVLQG